MSLDTYCEALAACLNSVDGLRCNSDGLLRDQVNPPEAMIDFEVDYDLTFARGADTYSFFVMVFDQRKSERASQLRLRAWRDGTSDDALKYVIENDAGVAAACDYTRVVSAGRPTVVTIGTVDYLMIELQLEVVL